MRSQVLILAVTALSMEPFSVQSFLSSKDIEMITALASDSPKLNVKSHLHCARSCLVRKACKFFGSTYLPTDSAFTGTKYKCLLDTSTTKDSPYNETRLCDSRNYHILKIPTVLAGACQDHKCNRKQMCTPRHKGGYKCIKSDIRKYRENKKRHYISSCPTILSKCFI